MFIYGSRYFNGEDAIDHFLHTLVENILLKLVWHEYLTFISPNYHDRANSRNSQDIPGVGNEPFPNKRIEGLDIKYSTGFVRDLGKCLVEILSGIDSLKPNLLLPFCATFEDNCMDIFKQTERTPENERIIEFLTLLDEHAVQKGETWPLVRLVGPMLAKSFHLIKALVSHRWYLFYSLGLLSFPKKLIWDWTTYIFNTKLSCVIYP